MVSAKPNCQSGNSVIVHGLLTVFEPVLSTAEYGDEYGGLVGQRTLGRRQTRAAAVHHSSRIDDPIQAITTDSIGWPGYGTIPWCAEDHREGGS
jgi:hypothetical protein